MKYTKQFTFIPIICLVSCVLSSAQAANPAELQPPLNELSIYSSAAITMGASSVVGGNVQVEAAATLGASSIVGGYIKAGAAVTLGATVNVGGFVEARDAGTIGADSTVGGYLKTGDAATLGATTIDNNVMVGGNLTAGAAILVGTKSVIAGNLKSGAAASADLGANALVRGDAAAGTALTLGADVIVDGDAQAGTGAVALGVDALVSGDATAGTSVSLAGGAVVLGTITEGSIEQFTNDPKEPIDDQSPQILAKQAELAAMQAPPENQLPTSITLDTTFKKGVYHGTALSTTAGIVITFDGENEDGHWIINMDSFISFGASTKIVLKDVTENSTITWNSGGYTDAGASVELIGTFFAGSYILTGASSQLKGIGGGCGGMFTSTGAVTLGASNLIGPINCGTSEPSSIDHYEIIHDGQGLTCDPESVIIRACDDANCSSLSSEQVTLNFLANDELISSPRFTGSTNVTFNHTAVETLTFSIANASITAPNPFVCTIDESNDSCDMAFSSAGFRFLSGIDNNPILPNQISGSVFNDTLKIQAVKDIDGVCAGLFTEDKNVGLSQENVNPGGTSGLSFTVDGNNIAKHPNFTDTELNFGNDSIAIILTPIYKDAGQIRLYAYYELGDVTVSGSSNSFWVSPARLIISAKSGTTDLDGATASALTTHPAGDDFELTVTAYNAANLPVITPNYLPGQIQLMLTRTGPTLNDSVDGDLNYSLSNTLTSSTSAEFQDVTLTSFSAGVSTYDAAKFSEVGLLNLDVQDSDYGDEAIIVSADAIDVGRFIPDYFTQTVAEDGFFQATCNTTITFVAYSGQKDEATNSIGAISYLTNPILEITAFSKQGNITQNYYQDSQGSDDDFMKLSDVDINILTPMFDEVATGVDSSKLPLTANINSGILSQNYLTALDEGDPLPKGVLHYQFSDTDHFFYDRSGNTLVSPFTSDIDFSIATIIDSDDVNVSTTEAVSPTGVEIRFGRLLLVNSFGPETSDLPQPMQIEHFDGTSFVDSTDDDCASYDADKISLTNISLDPALTDKLGGTGKFSAGKTQAIELQAPGTGNQGQLGVLYAAYDWFKYDWDNEGIYDDDPSAVVTFGVFRGNDRIIQWREIFN